MNAFGTLGTPGASPGGTARPAALALLQRFGPRRAAVAQFREAH